MYTPISLADLAIAFRLLQPDDADVRARIAALLGFVPEELAEVREAASALAPALPPIRPKSEPAVSVSDQASVPTPESETQVQVEPPSLTATGSLQFDLVDVTPSGDAQPPEWWVRVEALPEDEGGVRTPPPEPLLLPQWTRTALTRILATWVPEGHLDVDRIVGTLARYEVLPEIPRLPLSTMRRGLQVLVDTSDAMALFRTDQRTLLRVLRNLIGSEFFETFIFKGAPDRDIKPLETRRTLVGYVPPPTGTPVLALTDLGIGRPNYSYGTTLPESWQAFARRVRAAGCLPLAFVPYERHRWPAILQGEMTIIHWDHQRKPPIPAPNVGGSAPSSEVAKLVENLSTSNPYAAALAMLVSLASRVEAGLLRAMRLTLLPGADGGAEADLWFSPLVESQNTQAMLLRPDVAEYLRSVLGAKKPQLEAAWTLLKAYRERAGAFGSTRIEEEINYLVARYGIETSRSTVEEEEKINYLVAHYGIEKSHATVEEAVEGLLRQVLKTLLTQQNEKDRQRLALWSAETIDSMPKVARASETGKQLNLAAQLRLTTRAVSSESLPEKLDGIQWLLPKELHKEMGGTTTTIGVRMEPSGLIFSEPPDEDTQMLPRIPITVPRILQLTWESDGSTLSRTIALAPGYSTEPIPIGHGMVTIRLLSGVTYELRPQTTFETLPQETIITDVSADSELEIPVVAENIADANLASELPDHLAANLGFNYIEEGEMMAFQNRVRAEAERFVALLPQQVQTRIQNAEANVNDLGIHLSQIQALKVMIDTLVARQRQLLEQLSPTLPQQQFSKIYVQLLSEISGANNVWRTFDMIMSQRQNKYLRQFLDAADLVTADCHLTCMRRAADWGLVEEKQFREPPLVYLGTEVSPILAERGSRIQALGLPIGKYNNLRLPIPIVVMPAHQAESIWLFSTLYHEVGHNLSQALGLGEHLVEELRRRIPTLSTVGIQNDRRGTWQDWSEEILADAFGVLLGGAGFAYTLTSLLLPQALQEGTLQTYESQLDSFVRIYLISALLRRCEIPDLTEAADQIKQLWDDLPKPPEIDSYILDSERIAEVCMTTRLEVLGKRSLRELVPSQMSDARLVNQLARFLLTGMNRPDLKGFTSRLVPPAAQIALMQLDNPTPRALAEIQNRAMNYLNMIARPRSL